jgi:TfoX/Sxy family transcriptional regulator of competence genes
VAYDQELADRVRELLAPRQAVSEREMFGGIGFMVGGNMACGVHGEELIVRLGSEEGARALEEETVRPFDLTGRPMKGWMLVEPIGHGEDDDLRRWVGLGVAYARSLPPK